MAFAFDETLAWICAASGMALFTAAILTFLIREKVRPVEAPAALLPAAFCLSTAWGGYALLQPAQSLALFRMCYTAGYLGLILGTALCAILCGTRSLTLLDRAAPWSCLAMALARFAQRWLMETGAGKGIDTDSFLAKIPFLILTDEWGEALLAVFVLETVCALLAMICSFRFRIKHCCQPGACFCLTAAVLLLPQILLEQFRSGHFMSWRLLRLEQVVIAVAILALLAVLCFRYQKQSGASVPAAWYPVPCFLLLLGVIAAMQFIMDGKLFELPVSVVWVLYVLSVAVLIATAVFAVRRLYSRRKESSL